MVKQVTVYSLPFYQNDDDNGGAQARAIAECTPNQITVKLLKPYRADRPAVQYWGVVTPDQFHGMVCKGNHYMYELISRYPFRVFFDVDRKDPVDDTTAYLNTLLVSIGELFPGAEFAVSGSIHPEKTSFHIILSNYLVKTKEERDALKACAKVLQKTHEHVDTSVYTDNRAMKAVNQSKPDMRVQSIIMNDCITAHYITCFLPEDSLPFPAFNETVQEEVFDTKIRRDWVDIAALPAVAEGDLPKCDIATDDLHITKLAPAQIVSILPNTTAMDFAYRFRVLRFCYHNQITFDYFFSWIRTKHQTSSPTVAARREKWAKHWARASRFPPCTVDNLLPYLIHFYPNIAVDRAFHEFANTFALPTERIEKIETITPECFQRDEKTLVFNVGMGGGKTEQTIRYLNGKSFVWITPNIALARNTHNRINSMYNGDEPPAKKPKTTQPNEVLFYSKPSTKEKQAGALREAHRLIVCLNSLHYLANPSIAVDTCFQDNTSAPRRIAYDVVVIDEIETLLKGFMGDFMDTRHEKRRIWSTFVQILREAKKVVFLDAFITAKTTRFIETVICGDYRIFERINEPTTRTVVYRKNKMVMIAEIIERLKEGKKLFIFWPYPDRTGEHLAMSDMVAMFEREAGVTGICYNSKVDDKIKDGLSNVNKSWANFQFVVTNNVVTVGVNYEGTDFDAKYIFVAPHNSPRDIAQVSYRARHLIDKTINVCFLQAAPPRAAWPDDTPHMDCGMYTNLYNSLLIEEKAPQRKTLNLFFSKAHFDQTEDDTTLEKELEKELEELLEKSNTIAGFMTIDDISPETAEDIKAKQFNHEATQAEKIQLAKFHFKRRFLPDVDQVALAALWDDKLIRFTDKVHTVLKSPDSVFNRIAQENSICDNGIFHPDVKNITWSDPVTESIFVGDDTNSKFHFRYMKPTSSKHMVAIAMYNEYFHRCIYETKKCTNKHVTYTTSQEAVLQYKFLREWMLVKWNPLTGIAYSATGRSCTYKDDERDIDADDCLATFYTNETECELNTCDTCIIFHNKPENRLLFTQPETVRDYLKEFDDLNYDPFFERFRQIAEIESMCSNDVNVL